MGGGADGDVDGYGHYHKAMAEVSFYLPSLPILAHLSSSAAAPAITRLQASAALQSSPPMNPTPAATPSSLGSTPRSHEPEPCQ
jgi:hypothetical protein